MLNLIEPFDFTSLGHNSPRALHLLVEATKLAFADREAHYGDPKHVKVPGDALLSKAYADVRRALIREDRAWPSMPAAGDPDAMAALRNGAVTAGAPRAAGSPGSLDTSYVAVVDAEGNGFSATPSDPNVDSPVVPGVGCVVSPRGSQGWLVPGHPSEVAPGKRPRLTPAPAMAFKDGRLFMPFGTPGGDVQQQAMLQVFLNITAYGMSPQQAVEAPRVATRSFPDSFWPHPDFPGRLDCERGIPAETRAALGGSRSPRRGASRRGLAVGGGVRGRGRRRWHADGGRRSAPRGSRHRLVAERAPLPLMARLSPLPASLPSRPLLLVERAYAAAPPLSVPAPVAPGPRAQLETSRRIRSSPRGRGPMHAMRPECSSISWIIRTSRAT